MCGTTFQWQPAPQLGVPATGFTIPAPPPRRGTPLLVWSVLGIGLVAVALFVSVVGVSLARERPEEASASSGTESPGPTRPDSGGAAGTTSGGTTGQRQTRAQAQARAVQELLQWSSASRAKLTAPLGQLDSCRGVAGALQVLRQVADERRRQRDTAEDLPVDLIDGGVQARTYLVEALGYSYDADLAYLEWGTYLRDHGCGGAGSELRYWDSAAVAADRAAAKERFVERWNSIADQFGLRRWTASEI
jgi:hypothetical protein